MEGCYFQAAYNQFVCLRAFACLYAGRVACCPLVSHAEYAPRALWRLEKRRSINARKKTGQTDGRTYGRQTVTLRFPPYAAILTNRFVLYHAQTDDQDVTDREVTTQLISSSAEVGERKWSSLSGRSEMDLQCTFVTLELYCRTVKAILLPYVDNRNA